MLIYLSQCENRIMIKKGDSAINQHSLMPTLLYFFVETLLFLIKLIPVHFIRCKTKKDYLFQLGKPRRVCWAVF